MYRINTSSEDIEYTSQQLLGTNLFSPIGVARRFFSRPDCIYRLAVCRSPHGRNYYGWAFITHGGTLMTYVTPSKRGQGIATRLVSNVCRGTVGNLYYAFHQQRAFFDSLPAWIAERYCNVPSLEALKDKRRPTPLEIAKEVRQRLVAIAKGQNRECLSGMCAIGAMALTRSLHEWKHYEAQMVLGKFRPVKDHLTGGNHCWTIIGSRIIDVTATQFGVRNKVVNCRSVDPRYSPSRVISQVQSMPRGWPREQLPLKKLIDKLMFTP